MVFGLTIKRISASRAACHILRTAKDGLPSARLVVTPNIQHVAEMQRCAEFREVMLGAHLVLPDGFPVALAGRLRGVRGLKRVTGRELTFHILSDSEALSGQRIFFVVDSSETKVLLENWHISSKIRCDLFIIVAPRNFEPHSNYASYLIDNILEFCPSIIFVCLGAPKSEIFSSLCTKKLSGFWILCVGQSVRLFLGQNPRVPKWIDRLYLEWLWRIMNEPCRLFPRYVACGVLFVYAMIFDLKRNK